MAIKFWVYGDIIADVCGTRFAATAYHIRSVGCRPGEGMDTTRKKICNQHIVKIISDCFGEFSQINCKSQIGGCIIFGPGVYSSQAFGNVTDNDTDTVTKKYETRYASRTQCLNPKGGNL